MGSAQEIRWFDISPCFVFHVMAAWEEGDEVNLVACRYDRFPEFINGEAFADKTDGRHPEKAYLHRWRLNLKTGAVKEDFLDDLPSEFPRIHEGRMGLNTRFGYTIAENSFGLIKYDLKTGAIQRLDRPTHKLSEPIFVPSPRATAEDAGWVLCYAYELASDSSALWVLDAAQLEAGPMATVALPRRVPFGFHGTWVPGEGIPV
jgi:carotenoid cleavage dioxygenase